MHHAMALCRSAAGACAVSGASGWCWGGEEQRSILVLQGWRRVVCAHAGAIGIPHACPGVCTRVCSSDRHMRVLHALPHLVGIAEAGDSAACGCLCARKFSCTRLDYCVQQQNLLGQLCMCAHAHTVCKKPALRTCNWSCHSSRVVWTQRQRWRLGTGQLVCARVAGCCT